MVVLHNSQSKKSVLPHEMIDGEIGIIIECQNNTQHVGKIVQRYKDDLICVGEGWGSGWTGNCKSEFGSSMKIEILPAGTLLEIK